MTTSPVSLATYTPPTTDIAPIFTWIGALIGIVVLGLVILLAVRRRLMVEDAAGSAGAAMTLHDLRTMLKSGEIDQDEFERMKAQIIGQASATSAPAGEEDGGADEVHDTVRQMREARARAEAKDTLTAKPGYDLTGEPLPGAEPDEST